MQIFFLRIFVDVVRECVQKILGQSQSDLGVVQLLILYCFSFLDPIVHVQQIAKTKQKNPLSIYDTEEDLTFFRSSLD